MMAMAISARAMPEWQRSIRSRRVMPRLTPAYRGELGKREVGRYRQDERGIVHRLARGERT
jgi:hypothetical protein